MTESIARLLEKRRDELPPPETFSEYVSDLLYAVHESVTALHWPSDRYRDDPLAYFQEILGIEPWARQIEVILAIRDYLRVAVRSGRKVSKSNTISGAALWFYGSFPDAQAVMTSTTSRQVDRILWRELRMMHARSGRCVVCRRKHENGERIPRPCEHSALIDGVVHELARSGVKSDDFREIHGFTAREGEAVQGTSGKNLIFFVDEASGVPQSIFDAIEGNRAGGARVALFGNPTKNEGEHYDAFHSKSDLYHTITISSEESPNVTAKEVVIPGLAEYDWIQEKKREWGENSPIYIVHIKGLHATHEDGRIFSIHSIAVAEQRWHDNDQAGRLFIGLDPAGESGQGDEAAFAIRRGLKILRIDLKKGLPYPAYVEYLIGLKTELALPRETPVVVCDIEGEVGSRVDRELREFLDGRKAKPFELVRIRSSDRAIRKPKIYDRMRDELTANFESWIREGGGIPEDTKLAKEMHIFEWEEQVNGRLKVVPPKKTLRKKEYLGRSPDRYDACALSCWEPLALLEDDLPDSFKKKKTAVEEFAENVIDPYANIGPWE